MFAEGRAGEPSPLHCNSFADDFRKQAAHSRCHFGTVFCALSAVILTSVSARVRNLARFQFRTERRLPIAVSSQPQHDVIFDIESLLNEA